MCSPNETTSSHNALFSPPPFCRSSSKSEKSRNETSLKLENADPAKLLLLYGNLANESFKNTEAKINSYLMEEADSDLVFMIHLFVTREEALVNVLGQEVLGVPLRIPVSEETIMNLVKSSDGSLRCNEEMKIQIDIILNKVLPKRKGDVVSVPILKRNATEDSCNTRPLQPTMIVCFVNSRRPEIFLIKLVNEVFKFCASIMENASQTEELAENKKDVKSLLTTIHKFMIYLKAPIQLIDVMLKEIAKSLNAKNCKLFLSYPDHIRIIQTQNVNLPFKSFKTLELVKENSIAENVALTGHILNVKGNNINLLWQNLGTGKIKNLLCFPIRSKNCVIGVIQAQNKRSSDFNRSDEEVAKIFGDYCGALIMYSLSYFESENILTKNSITNNIMTQHMKVNEEDVVKKTNCPLIHSLLDFDSFDFNPRSIFPTETVCFAACMFEDLGFLKEFKIDKLVLMRFVMFVKQGHRDVMYRDWMHSFAVMHFAYACIKSFRLLEDKHITDLEGLAYLVACMCCNLDYKGTNNMFQKQNNGELASLHSSPLSIAERYYFSQAIRVLNIKGCNFLEHLNHDEYELFINLLKDIMLASDLATHFKFYRKQYDMTREGYNKNNPEHRYVLVSLLMTCAVLSDHTKEWSSNRKIVEKMYQEFLTINSQANKEVTTSIMFPDSGSIAVPEIQIEFLSEVCLPAFQLLAAMFSSASVLVNAIKHNIFYWEISKHVFKKYLEEGKSQMEILQSNSLEEEVYITAQQL